MTVFTKWVIDTPFLLVSVDESITVYDNNSWSLWRCWLNLKTVVTFKWVYLFQPKEQNLSTQNSKAGEVLENTARLLRSAQAWIDNSVVQTKGGCGTKEASLSFDARESWAFRWMNGISSWNRRWPSLLIHDRFKTRFNTAKDHRIRLLLRLPYVKQWQAFYEVVTRPNKPTVYRKILKIHNTNNAVSTLWWKRVTVAIVHEEYENHGDDTIAVTILFVPQVS